MGKLAEGGSPRQNHPLPFGKCLGDADVYGVYNNSRLLGSIWPGNEPAIGTMSGEIDALYIYDEHK